MTRADLTTGVTVAQLFRFALAREWGDLRETEADRLKFFALCRFCGHKASDPNDCGRYLTYCLKEKLFGNIRAEDDEAARRYLAGVRSSECGVRSVELYAAAATLFVPPAEEKQIDRRAELARRAEKERTGRQ